MMLFDLLGLEDLTLLVLVSIGISAVITGSKAGYPIRVIWCFIFQWRRLQWLWGVVRCPYCNAFWSGGTVGYLVTGSWVVAAQNALTCCGVMKIIQTALGGHGIAMVDKYIDAAFGQEEDNYGE